MEKIGPHGQRSTPEFQRWAKVARIAKAMDVGALAAAKAANPTLFTVYRYPLADEGKDTCTPEHLAALTISALGDFRPDAVEYKNEWRCYGWDDSQRHIDELRRFAKIMHQYGLKVIGGNWSFGTPEREDVLFWQAKDWGGIDYLGLHAYSNKYVLLSDIWTILRHRLVHEWTRLTSSLPPLQEP